MMDFHFMLREEHYVERYGRVRSHRPAGLLQGGRQELVGGAGCVRALGVSSEIRQLYKVWEEGKVPDFGDRIRLVAHGGLRCPRASGDLYESWGCGSTGSTTARRLHAPRLQGFVLEEGRYEPNRAGAAGWRAACIVQRGAGVELHFDGERLRVWDPVRKQYLLTPKEAKQGRQ